MLPASGLCLVRLPALWDIEFVGMKYPTDYYESGNTVLVQETQRYNNLLGLMKKSLAELQKALKVRPPKEA